MRTRILFLLLTLLTLCQVATAQGHQIVIVNKTGSDIKAVYIAPSSDEEFAKSDELLHGQNFADGKALTISYTGNAPAWDLLVTWKDGSGDEEWSKLKLVPGGTYALLYNGETTSLKKL